jgi:nucleotide-binding universal stress UspA family protein
MKSILIPTDFSENSWNAIEYALRFLSKSACNFYLLHVTTTNSLVESGVSNLNTQDTHAQILSLPTKKRLHDTIKKIQIHFPNPLHRFFSVTDSNSLINAIREQVVQKKIDLIVMGTKGRSDMNKLAIGTNAGNVITKVKCATMVIPEEAKYIEPKEIAFPTDFSIFYRPEVLQPITDIIENHRASIRVLHINRQGFELNDDQQKNKEYLDDYFNNYNHSFHFLTNIQLEDAVQQFVDDRNIHVIAMLAKNLNYFQKILFHPTSQVINYYKHVPFLVLH